MKIGRRLISTFLIACLLLGCLGVSGAQASETCVFEGRTINDGGDAIPNVRVYVEDADKNRLEHIEEVRTDIDGHWEFELPKGYTYRFVFMSTEMYRFTTITASYGGELDDIVDTEFQYGVRKEAAATETKTEQKSDAGKEAAFVDDGKSTNNTTVDPALEAGQVITVTPGGENNETGEGTGEGNGTDTDTPSEEDLEPITPPANPVLTRESSVLTVEDHTITWSQVAEATYYLFSFVSVDGEIEVYERTRVEDTKVEIPLDEIVPDRAYLASVSAVIALEGRTPVESKQTHWMYEYKQTVAEFEDDDVTGTGTEDGNSADETQAEDPVVTDGSNTILNKHDLEDETGPADDTTTDDDDTSDAGEGTGEDDSTSQDGDADGTDDTDKTDESGDGDGDTNTDTDGTDGTDNADGADDGDTQGGDDGADDQDDDLEMDVNTPDVDGDFVDDTVTPPANRMVTTFEASLFSADTFAAQSDESSVLVLAGVNGTKLLGSKVNIALTWQSDPVENAKFDLYFGMPQDPEDLSALPQVLTGETTTSFTYTIASNAIVGMYAMYVQVDDTEPVKSNAVFFPVINPTYEQKQGWVNVDTTDMYWRPALSSKVTKADIARNTEISIVGELNGFYLALAGMSDYGFIDSANVTLENPTNYGMPKSLRVVVPTEDNPFVVANWTSGDAREHAYEVKVYKGTTLLDTYTLPPLTTTFTYPKELAYNTDYTITVSAVAKDTTSTIGPSVPAEVQFRTGSAPVTTVAAPLLNGHILYGFLEEGASPINWSKVTGAVEYDWFVASESGTRSGTTQDTTIPWTAISGLPTAEMYTLKVRTVAANGKSVWRAYDFMLVPRGTAYIADFSMPSSAVKETNFVMTLIGVNFPTGTGAVRIYVEKEGNTQNGNQSVTVVDGKVTHQFATAGTYHITFRTDDFNSNFPRSKTHTIVITEPQVDPVRPVITAVSNPQTKSKTFNLTWSAAATGAIYSVNIRSLDGKVNHNVTNLSTTTYAVPADVLSQIGPFYAVVTAAVGNVIISSEAVYFDVVDGSYTAAKGKVKKNDTKTYMTADSDRPSGITLAKDHEVTIVGALNKYYHIKHTTTVSGSTTGTTVYLFIPETDVTKTSSGGSSSGGSSGGSSSGGGSSGGSSGTSSGSTGGTFTLAAYKQAFGTETERRNSYAYINDLYAPLMERIEKGELVPKTQLSLLTTIFSPFPSELNSSQYDAVHETAGWNLVTAYMYLLAMDAATDDVLAQQNALQRIADSLETTINELISQNKTLDESSKQALTQVMEQARAVKDSSSAGSLGGTRHEATVAALERIMHDLPYNPEIFEAVKREFDTVEPGVEEPTEVRFIRVLYAFSELMEAKVTAALAELPEEPTKEDIDKLQNAYLNYVFAVAKLHNMSYAFAGAAAEIVVQNWGAEITRLIAVNKSYNDYK